MNNLDRMKQALAREDYPQALEAEALRLVEEDKQLCDRIAEAGSALVKPGSRLLTHCNTGGLATAGVGTALGLSRWRTGRERWPACGSMKPGHCCRADV